MDREEILKILSSYDLTKEEIEYLYLQLYFTEQLNNQGDEQILEFHKEQKENRDSILNEIAKVMLSYPIIESIMSIVSSDKLKLKKQLNTLIQNKIQSELNYETLKTKELLESTGKNKYNINNYINDIGMNVNWNIKPVEDKILNDIINKKVDNKTWDDRLWDNKNDLQKDLKAEIDNFLNGKTTVNEIEEKIKKKYNENAYETKRLVHTEIARVQESINQKWAKEHGVKYQLFMATLDYKTSQRCRSLDGKVFEFDNVNKPIPPLHPFCRSTLVNIPNKDWRPSQRLDNVTKKRIDWQDYENWHKNYVENNPVRFAEEKKYKNRFYDKKQYEKYKEILGDEAPKSFDKFQELKYNNTNEWELFKDYTKSRSNNMISAFTSFDNYKMYKYKVEKELVGLTTSNGIKITGQSKHFLERIFGTSEDPKTKRPREGVEIEDIKDALLNGTIRIRKTDPNSIKFVTDKCMVSINPNTGNLIQANP